MPKLLTILASLTPFLLIGSSVYGQNNITINEFYALGSAEDPDWIELYNKSESSVDLDSWLIRDKTESNKITLSGSICAKGFRKFTFSNKLNNSGDTIRLLDKNGVVEEAVYFTETVPSHSQNQSTSKIPDGGPMWQTMTSPTPNDDISCNTPSPNPTPTSSSVKPTSSPQITSQAKSPSPISSPTVSTKSPVVTATVTSKPSPTVLGEANSQSTASATRIAESSLPNPSPDVSQSQNSKVAASLTGGGLVMVAAAIGLFLWYKGKEGSKEKDTNE